MLTETQLRLMIGDAEFDAIPNRQKANRLSRMPRRRSARNQARQRVVLGGRVPAVYIKNLNW
jgi:hypothetical protein